MAEKEIRLCKNIAKFSQNLPFQVAKFCILNAKFEICFCKKPRGQSITRIELEKVEHCQFCISLKLIFKNSPLSRSFPSCLL